MSSIAQNNVSKSNKSLEKKKYPVKESVKFQEFQITEKVYPPKGRKYFIIIFIIIIIIILNKTDQSKQCLAMQLMYNKTNN